MAATGKTPILLYGSTTPTNAPVAGNLTNSSDGCEIAINVADKNLFFKDSTNAVNTVPIRQSSASSSGWLSSTDWNTFNSKQPAGTYVTSVTGTAPVVSSGGTTPAISMAAANGSTNGYLTSTDWTTFNNKSPAAGSSSITTVGTITSGTWNGSAIDVAHGGTGLTSLTAGYIPYGNGTGAFSSSGNFYYNGTDLRILNGGAKVGGVIWTGGGAAFGNNGVGMWFDTGSNTGYLRSYHGGVDWRDMVYNAKTHQFQTNDNNVVKIHNSGGVSIGNTTDPGATNLSVSGNVLSGSTNTSYTSGVGTKIKVTGFGGTAPTIGTVGNSNSTAEYCYMTYSSSASKFVFYVDYAGNIYAQNTSITSLSDGTLKTNLKPLETGLDEVMKLIPRRFDWVDGSASNVAGFIAQEVEKVLPDLISENIYSRDNDGNDVKKKMIKMGDMIPTLVSAIQQQQKIIDDLQTRLTALEK